MASSPSLDGIALVDEILEGVRAGKLQLANAGELNAVLRGKSLSPKVRRVVERALACRIAAERTSWDRVEQPARRAFARLFFLSGTGVTALDGACEELHMLEAKVLIRVGTCGGTSPNLDPADLLIAQASLARDGTTKQYMGEGNHTPIASWRVSRAAQDAARALKVPHVVGLISSDDSFYSVTSEEARGLFTTRGVLGIEMEASAVFTVATLRGMEAGCLTTVSNYIGDESMVPDEVLKMGVDNMVRTALETILILEAERPLPGAR